jgi:prepilin-type N-terminal cleavage/methylation domain-containing protein
MISSSIMVVREAGFTITEMVVTLVIITIFMTLFFQLFLTGLSQQTVVTSQAAANDIALSNLSKITS